jgi:hypothetical protein
MPFRRMFPVLLVALTFLVASCAQRLLLLWLTQASTHPTSRDVAPLLVHGTRVDLGIAAFLVLPGAAWLSLLPEKIFAAKWHRWSAAVKAALATLLVVAFLTVDALQFTVHHARLAPPVRQRLLIAWHALGSDDERAKLGAAIVTGILLATALLVVATRRPWKAAWESLEPVAERLRDLVIVIGLGAALILTMPRKAPFPDRPVLGEVAGSSIPPLARAALARLQR